MNWKQDDLGYFANHAGRSAQVVRDGRRWRWIIFGADGRPVMQARSRSLDEAKSNSEWGLRR